MAEYDWTCQACGDKERGLRYPVLERLSDGDQKQIMVCESCASHFEKVEYLIRWFDGQLFPIEEGQARKWWKNDVPLHYTHRHIVYYMLDQEVSHLDEKQRVTYLQERALDPARIPVPLADFPLVEDFNVNLETLVARHNIHKMLVPYFFAILYSPSLGYLGGFSGHIQSDYMCRSEFVIPHGDFTLPYYDYEQGISQLIFEDDHFVYIIGGSDEITGYVGYETWFKVTKKSYYAAWEDAIQRSCAYHGRETSS